jgi:hypothetical protein
MTKAASPKGEKVTERTVYKNRVIQKKKKKMGPEASSQTPAKREFWTLTPKQFRDFRRHSRCWTTETPGGERLLRRDYNVTVPDFALPIEVASRASCWKAGAEQREKFHAIMKGLVFPGTRGYVPPDSESLFYTDVVVPRQVLLHREALRDMTTGGGWKCEMASFRGTHSVSVGRAIVSPYADPPRKFGIDNSKEPHKGLQIPVYRTVDDVVSEIRRDASDDYSRTFIGPEPAARLTAADFHPLAETCIHPLRAEREE